MIPVNIEEKNVLLKFEEFNCVYSNFILIRIGVTLNHFPWTL